MNIDAGYIYVLINPSMSGLVKVGRTSRDPKDRVSELSMATGIPTPFVLVYSAYFHDCPAAEGFVHTLLEVAGHKVARNREFFSAPVQEVIDTILKAKQILGTGATPNLQDDETDVPDPDDEEEYKHSEKPWDESESRALDSYNGSGDALQDYKKALNLFKQAARLGSDRALTYLGLMYQYGKGCSPDTELALEYYEQAAKKGDGRRYIEMARLFFTLGQYENGQKCWLKYFKSETFKEEMSRGEIRWVDGCLDGGVPAYLEAINEHEQPIVHLPFLMTIKNQILESYEKDREEDDDDNKEELQSYHERQIRMIKDLLFK